MNDSFDYGQRVVVADVVDVALVPDVDVIVVSVDIVPVVPVIDVSVTTVDDVSVAEVSVMFVVSSFLQPNTNTARAATMRRTNTFFI